MTIWSTGPPHFGRGELASRARVARLGRDGVPSSGASSVVAVAEQLLLGDGRWTPVHGVHSADGRREGQASADESTDQEIHELSSLPGTCSSSRPQPTSSADEL